MESLALHSWIQAAAVLIGYGRGLWRWYPAWTSYLLIATTQGLILGTLEGQTQRQAGGWAVAAPFILLGLVDSVLELFRRLSELYRRFHRERWKWLLVPVTMGIGAGLWIASHLMERAIDFYTSLFLAQTMIGAVCAFVLAFGWIASIPVRIPINLRKHLVILGIYVGTNTIGFLGYFADFDKQLVRNILNFMPPVLTLAWSLLLDPLEEEQTAKAETEMPDSTLEQLLGLLRRLS